MSELDIVLESYREMFGVKTERGNEIHRLACEEVARLRETVKHSLPIGRAATPSQTHEGVHCRNCQDIIKFSEMKPYRKDDDTVDMLCPGCDCVLVEGE